MGIYPEETRILKIHAPPVFIAPLFTIAKTWKQSKYPSADEWIKKMSYIYTMEYYFYKKKNEVMPFATTQMDLKMIVRREVSQRKISCDTAYIWHVKI